MSKLGITEVVLRDGNQSLLATKISLEDLLPAARLLDEIGYWSIESWGGATFDVCLRHLNEDPWERLKELKKAMPKTPQQMLLRGQNLVGYKHFSDQIVSKFINKSAENGIDVFRIFDALNDIENIRFSLEQVKENNKHAQAAMAYTTSPIHNIQYWLDLAKSMEDIGIDSIAIKDMAGILKPNDAFQLISKLKEELSIPIHMQTHATTGMSTATNLKAIEAGIDNIDTSISSMSMTYGHSSTETLVSMLQDTDLSLDFDLLKLDQISQYFKKIRNKYSEFEGSLKGVDVQMLVRQVPGGMLSNLESQLKQMNLEDKLEEVIQEIPRVRKDLGYLPLVTPVSQIIGAQALSNIIDGKRYEKLSIELTKLISGYYGKIFGKVEDDLKDKARLEMEPIKTRPADDLVNDFKQLKEDLSNFCLKNSLKDASQIDENVLSFALFPYSSTDFLKIITKNFLLIYNLIMEKIRNNSLWRYWFYGQLCAKYFKENYSDLNWAIAGRNKEKLEEIKENFALEVDVLVADGDNLEALRVMAGQTKVVVIYCSSPFARYSDLLVQACVEQGTHYTDITGENHWVRTLIDKHRQTTRV